MAEIFFQDGRYGVTHGGRVTCRARFSRVERLPEGCGFFALGVYTVGESRAAGRTAEVTTVIGHDGRDLEVRLCGQVQWRDGYFYGESAVAGFCRASCWDPVGNVYYDTDPCFRRVAGVEVGLATEHGRSRTPCMRLRRSRGSVSPRFNTWEMFYNRFIIIARDYLIVKRDGNHAYRIRGYAEGGIVVERDGGAGYQLVTTDGRAGTCYERLPAGCSKVADYRQMGLRRVQSK